MELVQSDLNLTGNDQLLTFMKCRSFADLGVTALTEAWNELVQRVKSTLQPITQRHKLDYCNTLY